MLRLTDGGEAHCFGKFAATTGQRLHQLAPHLPNPLPTATTEKALAVQGGHHFEKLFDEIACVQELLGHHQDALRQGAQCAVADGDRCTSGLGEERLKVALDHDGVQLLGGEQGDQLGEGLGSEDADVPVPVPELGLDEVVGQRHEVGLEGSHLRGDVQEGVAQRAQGEEVHDGDEADAIREAPQAAHTLLERRTGGAPYIHFAVEDGRNDQGLGNLDDPLGQVFDLIGTCQGPAHVAGRVPDVGSNRVAATAYVVLQALLHNVDDWLEGGG